ncbi:MAG: hypothetical protein A4E28_00896 [Methanocella sp. PtaU1.Bin125]|nr:MAG: hypothetical protein A4E28_00896 [Methanocella sp. PtaU1.Bin125]
MRTPGQRKEIYEIVKARLAQGMSGRAARANIDYDGKVFDLDFKTWKTYAAEFDGSLPEVRATSHPSPDRELIVTPAAAPALFTAPATPYRHAGRRPGVHKTRFLVALSDSRLEQLKAEALRKDKTYAALAVDYIIEGLERVEKSRGQAARDQQ